MSPDSGQVEIRHSVCPHDCPSTCALEVERLGPTRIGRVHGARANSYTAGVVCAKVARYAERQHHPDRLARPLKRVGAKGVGREAFAQITWGEALDEIADRFTVVEREWGAEAVFPYFYAGTMGLVQRDGIERLRHEKRYSRQKSTICVALSDAGWTAGVGSIRGVDPREMAESDLIVVWGGNPVATQVNVMTHIARARKARGAKLIVVDPYRTGTAEAADLHIMLRPGTDGALAVAMINVLFAEGYADRAYMARYADDPAAMENHVRDRTPMGRDHHRRSAAVIRGLQNLWRDETSLSGLGSDSAGRAAPCRCSRFPPCRRSRDRGSIGAAARSIQTDQSFASTSR
jgi:anaerobic selenocysteine-containing dehydrogenase